MPVKVTAEIDRLLHADDAPWQGYTYRALAKRVYDVYEPSAAELSAVRRSVAALVAKGRAEHRNREWVGDKSDRDFHTRRVLRTIDSGSRKYTVPGEDGVVRRVRYTELEWQEVLCENPGGVRITRASTPEERRAHDEELRKWAERDRELDR